MKELNYSNKKKESMKPNRATYHSSHERIRNYLQRHIYYAAIVLLIYAQSGFCIDCFKCVSYNGANKACDDPFHNNYSTSILESPCMGGRKGRDGLFPATACIKIAGYYDDNGTTITVRGCALDSGTLTTDTEIIRMSHCGKFYFDGRYVHGCLQSCNDADACNAATPSTLTATASWGQNWSLQFKLTVSLLSSLIIYNARWFGFSQRQR